MDNEEYKIRAQAKVIQYRKAGFKQFDNLICTWEEDLEDMHTIENIIYRFILNSQI